ncbi:DUF2950 family protein [Enterobacter bugandensis]|uniref:DUF2950 family protein n=1 Tax=Enterobacter bugandensis TaxID=881260 RepID=UPI002665E1C5|nr:DUF2950 family protein [Enterobacter bugandensis]MDO2432687.1 DUF2950 family protein [Enterobacter bugandensis]MDO2445869.1 DUF2950 family protein [Enterobacter bugandensis]
MKRKLLSGMVLFMVSATVMAQQSFSSPEQATNALQSAIRDQNESAMSNLLGENWRDFLPPEGVAPDAVDRFLRDWKVRHNTIVEGDKAYLVVGDSGWQLPIPVIKTASGWHFDIKEGAEEILTREIGRNELAAIEALHAYVAAQQSYFAMNQKYAQKIVSSEGKKDGLYWPVSPGEAPSPLGPAFSPKEPGAGYHGYRFRILPDKNGFAMVAWPVSYGQTGIMSFLINQDDRVYQRDLGKETEDAVQAIGQFTSENPWQKVTP